MKNKSRLKFSDIISYKSLTDAKQWVRCILVPKKFPSQMLTGNDDKDIFIYDISLNEEGESKYIFNLSKKLEGHTEGVVFLSEMRNGNILSSSLDKTIRIWDLRYYQNIMTLSAHTDVVWRVKQVKDDQIISCSGDKTLRLWNCINYDYSVQLNGHNERADCFELLKNGQLVSGSWGEEKKLLFWDYSDNSKKYEVNHKLTINDVVCISRYGMIYNSQDNQLLVGGIGNIYVIDVSNYAIRNIIKEPIKDLEIRCLCLYEEKKCILVGCSMGILVKLDKDFNYEETLKNASKDKINCIEIIDKECFAIGDNNYEIKIWETKKKETKKKNNYFFSKKLKE